VKRVAGIVIILIVCCLVAVGVHRLHRILRAGKSAEAVVEKFLWALDRGDMEAARQLVLGGHQNSPNLRRGAAYFGPERPIRRLVFTGSEQWGWDGWRVAVTVEWKAPHPAPDNRQPTLFWAFAKTLKVWSLGFQLERGRWWGPWKIVQAQGGC
jgi:hypothetical protein